MLGTLKTKDAGYIKGVMDHLQHKFNKDQRKEILPVPSIKTDDLAHKRATRLFAGGQNTDFCQRSWFQWVSIGSQVFIIIIITWELPTVRGC